MATSAARSASPPRGGGWTLRLFAGAVVVVAALVVGRLLLVTDWTAALDAPAFWALLVLCFVTEASPLQLPGRKGDINNTSGTFAYALVLTAGVTAGLVAHVLAIVVVDVIHRRGALKVAFNASQLALSLFSAGVVVALVTGTPLGDPITLDAVGVVAAVTGIVAYLAVNRILLAVVFAILDQTSVRAQLMQDGASLTSDASHLLLAPLVAAVASVHVALMVLLLVPMVAVHRTTALYLAREQLLAGQKLEALGRLSGGVAHDFNNLLAVVLGNAELLARDITDPEQLARLDELRAAGQRGAALADQILSFTRGQQATRVPVDVHAVVHAVQPMLTTLVGPNTRLEVELGEEPVHIHGTETQLEQILVNLVVNARDAMPSGGTLRIAVGAVDDRTVSIEVTDTGIGMDDETRSRVFEPFYTTKSHGRGTGLGLSTVYGIVSGWNGEITVDSAPGAGTTMRMTLPTATPADPPSAPLPSASVDRGSAAGRTVLVVEDQDPLRRIVVGVLEQAGYRVLAAAEPAIALEVAAAHEGTIDLLLTDLSMPGMSGTELARRLRALRPAVAVLCMTGFASVGQEDLEGFEVLQKPFGLAELDEKVRGLLDRPTAA